MAALVLCIRKGLKRRKKYTISRILMALERDGFVNREDSRSPYLTELGKIEALE